MGDMNIGIYFRMTNHVAPVKIFQISLNKIITGSRDIFILEKESSINEIYVKE